MPKYLLLLFACFLFTLQSNIALNSLQLGAPWPKEGRNEFRSSQSAFDINTTFPPLEKWKISLGSTSYSSPIIGNDGTIYIGTISGLFYAIHGSLGVIKYQFQCGAIYSTALIDSNDHIYVTSTDYYIYALDTSLRKQWFFKTNSRIYASPNIDSSYNVYFGN